MKTERDLDAFMAAARQRFSDAKAAEQDIRDEAEKDLEFLAGDQWDERAKQERLLARRPVLIFNKLPTFVAQVANEARQNKPAVKFSPADSGSDVDTARVFTGLARRIQYNSDAEVAYETAIDYSASCSFGMVRLLSDYIDPKSFHQDLKVGAILDPFSVYGALIPACLGQKPRHIFIVERMSRDEFKAQWPKSELVSCGFQCEYGDWVDRESVCVAEYWWLETRTRTLVQLEDGSTAWEDELPEGAAVKLGPDGQPMTRESQIDSAHTCKMNGVEILPGTETEWRDEEIPIWPVLGKALVVKGKPKLFSVIRFARDPQQMINYAKTRIVETLATSPISPYVGAHGQFKGHEAEWRTANNSLRAYQEYVPISVDGVTLPPPQRQVYEPPIQALSQFVAQEVDDIKASTSIFDPSLGDTGNETSGIAIARRQRQSGLSNLHFIDNLARVHRKIGRAIARLIPVYYDAARETEILGEDEQPSVVKVNQWYEDEKGKRRYYRMDAGRYDVTVTTGPSYTTKRQEAFELLTQLAQAYPQLIQIAGDIIMRNSDIPGADELAERLKKLLPAELQNEEDQDEQRIPPQVAQQMQMLAQQHEQLTQALDQANQLIEGKQLELESRERIEADKLQFAREELSTNAELEMAKLGSVEAIEELRQELTWLKGQIDAQLARESAQDQAEQHATDLDFQAQQAAQAQAQEGLDAAA